MWKVQSARHTVEFVPAAASPVSLGRLDGMPRCVSRRQATLEPAPDDEASLKLTSCGHAETGVRTGKTWMWLKKGESAIVASGADIALTCGEPPSRTVSKPQEPLADVVLMLSRQTHPPTAPSSAPQTAMPPPQARSPATGDGDKATPKPRYNAWGSPIRSGDEDDEVEAAPPTKKLRTVSSKMWDKCNRCGRMGHWAHECRQLLS